MAFLPNDSVELRHLFYFQAVADAGGFTRAAAIIGVRQPTLSSQIKQLEHEFGVILFHRTRRMCRLTPAGELLLVCVKRLQGEMVNLRRSLDDLNGLRQGDLTVAALPVFSHWVMPRAAARFHLEYPNIRMRVLEMSVDNMEAALVRGDVELGLGCMPAGEKSLRARPLFEDELVAVVREDDKLASLAGGGRNAELMKALLQRPMAVFPHGHGMRTIMKNTFAAMRHAVRFALEAEPVNVLLEVTRQCGCASILPASALWGMGGGDARQLAVVPLGHPELRRRIGFLSLCGVRPRPPTEAFMSMTRDVLAAARGPAGGCKLVDEPKMPPPRKRRAPRPGAPADTPGA
ncbi:MAG: LysR family transcriptional regulator [Opitutaceae bacterium]|jgi:LysR family cyn operon transcriptional activator|nr:LysR family transcriptional regulator [Opitutaceae bacterium]